MNPLNKIFFNFFWYTHTYSIKEPLKWPADHPPRVSYYEMKPRTLQYIFNFFDNPHVLIFEWTANHSTRIILSGHSSIISLKLPFEEPSNWSADNSTRITLWDSGLMTSTMGFLASTGISLMPILAKLCLCSTDLLSKLSVTSRRSFTVNVIRIDFHHVIQTLAFVDGFVE